MKGLGYMYGAIIGDVAGSVYEVKEMKALKNSQKVKYEERIKILDKNTPLFSIESSYTDDSVLTSAVAKALLEGARSEKDFSKYLKEFGLKEIVLGKEKYGRNRFGKGFTNWVLGDDFINSYGNGCAMRISPVAMYFDSLKEIKQISDSVTKTTHMHEESIKAVDAVCLAIYYAKQKENKEFIKQQIEEKIGYDLNFSLEELQKNYTFTSRSKDSVPQAIFCFLISEDFEDAIRKAISIGGDTDTIACIAGSIAENYYGIPEKIKEEVKPFIPDYIKDILDEFYSQLEKNKNENKYKRRIK